MPLFKELHMDRSLPADSASIPQKFDSVNKAQPQTFAQWQTACAFVKYLYLQGSHNFCIVKSKALLASDKLHTVHRTYLHFYAALSYETVAESNSNDHAEFYPSLSNAEQHLAAALACLPVDGQQQPKAAVTTTSPSNSYEALKRDIASQQRTSSESSRPSTDLPSHRDSRSSHTTITNPVAATADTEDLVGGARGRHDRILTSLRPELEAHMAYMRRLRQESTEITTRNHGRTGDDTQLRQTLAKFAVKQRVADGRKRNWKRTRFSLTPIETEQIDEEPSLPPD